MTDIATPSDIVSDIVASRIGRQAEPYQPVINAVITALENRDVLMADRLRSIGNEMDLDPMKVEAALVEVGLARMPVVDEPDANDEDTPAWALALIQKIDGAVGRIEGLENIARSRGLMGR